MTGPAVVMEEQSCTRAERLRRDKLFAANPTCDICHELIEEVGGAMPFKPVGLSEVLIHRWGGCFHEALVRSIEKYRARAEGVAN
jgi:hypothetical protein